MKRGETRVLVVEDESIISLDLMYMIESCGFCVECCVRTGEQAIEKVCIHQPDIVLMDIKLAGKIDGIETAKKIREFSNIPFIFITSNSDEATLRKAKETHPIEVLIKPVVDVQLCKLIRGQLVRP